MRKIVNIWKAAVALVALPTLVLSGCVLLHLTEPAGADRDESGAIVEEGRVDVFSIRVGDCLTGLKTTRGGQGVTEGEGIPCSEPHKYEVFYHEEHAVSGLLGAEAVADQMCSDAFESFLGFPPNFTSLNFTWLIPTPESFESGDRAISCLVHRFDQALVTGSLEGKGSDYWVESASYFRLGECVNGLDESEDSTLVSGVVHCDEPHVWEVFHVGFLPDEIEPPIDEASQDICLDAFEPFVGRPFERSVFDFSWYQPFEETFPLGDRRVACLIHTVDLAPVAGSLEGSNR